MNFMLFYFHPFEQALTVVFNNDKTIDSKW